MSMGEIWLIPFFGQGHLLPTIELCKHIASRNFITTLVISSDLSSSVPSSLRNYPLVQVLEIPPSPPPPQQPPSSSDPMHHQISHHSHMAEAIQDLLSARSGSNSALPLCTVVDVMMSWTSEILNKFQIPHVAFFTSGACSAAMELAVWKYRIENLNPGEVRLLAGLPDSMAITDSDLKRRPHGHGHGHGPPPTGSESGGPGHGRPGRLGLRKFGGPPKPGGQPPWLEESGESMALMINTCDIIERPFIEYLSDQIGKPVWGVGPLLPEQYWKSAGSNSIMHDHESRPNRRSTITEEEVISWLDSKPRGSTLYVSFGSEVGPTMEEYPRLADALEASGRPFIWVIQPGAGRSGPPRAAQKGEGYTADGLDKRVGERGLIIHGWAPQLLILSHKSTGGFLSHCGWNSSVEAIGRGIPILAWPIRGDQYYNAGLIAKHLKIGYPISDDFSKAVTNDDIVNGIEKLLADENMRKRAESVGDQFGEGFPLSSMASLDAFKDFVMTRKSK
ncbi:UDP-Glycosyltransferase superfamily protein [Euphorbia peplus]|nr:UDP-Glycosyltransferase superfamily protein [Euphorbia peplus]